MQVQPYLLLDGRCEETIEVYKGTLGINLEMLMRFKDSPEPMQPGCSQCSAKAGRFRCPSPRPSTRRASHGRRPLRRVVEVIVVPKG